MSAIHTVLEESPLGQVLLTGDDRGITSIHTGWHGVAPPGRRDDSALAEAVTQLSAYFTGVRHEFTLPLSPAGTPFQRAVWEALRDIPYGETTTYGAIAARVGRPSAVRAVGAAIGRNPIAIVIPCHRVIGASGQLTGYAGGLAAKRALLDLEALAAGTRLA